MTQELPTLELDPVKRLTRDLKLAAVTLSLAEVRFLADSYYQIQEYRKASSNQVLSLENSGEPHSLISWLTAQNETLENQLKRALDAWTEQQPVGRWCKSHKGVGPIITAGLLAYIDITKAPTAGHIWRYFGLDPSREWLGKDRSAKLVAELMDKLDNENDLETLVALAAGRTNVKVELLMQQASTDRDGNPEKLSRATITRALSLIPWNKSAKTLCVHPDSRITTLRGHIPISEVMVGDSVMTHEGRWKQVTKTFVNHYAGQLNGIRSSNAGNNVAWLTDGHPVYAKQTECYGKSTYLKQSSLSNPFDWHAAEAIKPRWILSRPIVKERNSDPIYLEFDGLHKGDYVVAQGGWEGVAAPRARKVLHRVEVDQQVARLIGLYLAEGHISRNNVTWSFHSEEQELIRFVVDMIKQLTGGIPTSVSYDHECKSCQVSIGCKPMAETFRHLFGTESYSVRFPMEWLSADTSLLQALWNGVMEGDGDHKGKFKNKRITTVNPMLARQLVDLGRRIGLSVSLHAESVQGPYRVMVNERPDVFPTARDTLHAYYEGPVCNLEVEDDHSYVVEGYAVHNCWKIGQSFMKFSGDEDCYYGKIYLERKAIELANNEAGKFADQAAAKLARFNYGKATEAYKAYSQGKLPLAHVYARARRVAVKLFLSHLQHAMFLDKYGTPPPKPYVIEHMGHIHMIEPPNLHLLTGDK